MEHVIQFAKMAYDSDLIPQSRRKQVFGQYVVPILANIIGVKKVGQKWIDAFDKANKQHLNVHSECFGQTGLGVRKDDEDEVIVADPENDCAYLDSLRATAATLSKLLRSPHK